MTKTDNSRLTVQLPNDLSAGTAPRPCAFCLSPTGAAALGTVDRAIDPGRTLCRLDLTPCRHRAGGAAAEPADLPAQAAATHGAGGGTARPAKQTKAARPQSAGYVAVLAKPHPDPRRSLYHLERRP